MTELDIALKAISLYASQHPRPAHVTQKQAALMLGKSEPTIGKMVHAGILKLNKCGMIPIAEIDKAVI